MKSAGPDDILMVEHYPERIRYLSERYRIRVVEIAEAVQNEPSVPSPSTIDHVRAHLAHVIAEGTSAERKATIAHPIAEIRITDGDKSPEPVDELGIVLKGPHRNFGNESNYAYGTGPAARRASRYCRRSWARPAGPVSSTTSATTPASRW